MPRNTGSSVHVTICFLDLCMQWDEIVSEEDFTFRFINLQFQTFFSYYFRPSFWIFLSLHNLKFRANPLAVRAKSQKNGEIFKHFLKLDLYLLANTMKVSWISHEKRKLCTGEEKFDYSFKKATPHCAWVWLHWIDYFLLLLLSDIAFLIPFLLLNHVPIRSSSYEKWREKFDKIFFMHDLCLYLSTSNKHAVISYFEKLG